MRNPWWHQRSPVAGLIFHSDRGCQYASGSYTGLLASHGIQASMSRKGNCWDNACSETLFGSLKVERLHGMDFHTHREAKGRHPRLAPLVQPIENALDARLPQPSSVRAASKPPATRPRSLTAKVKPQQDESPKPERLGATHSEGKVKALRMAATSAAGGDHAYFASCTRFSFERSCHVKYTWTKMPGKKTFATLQAGRGIAAMMVVFYHSSGILTLSKYWNYKGFNYAHFGYTGVEYFFVLSGIVILYAHWDDIGQPAGLKRYFWKRFRRIYPFYWVILFSLLPIYLLVPSFGNGSEHHIRPLIDSIVLLPIFQTGTILPTAWTLFHEVMFYLVFAVAIANRKAGAVVLSFWLATSFVSCFYTPASKVLAACASPLHLLFALGLASVFLVRKRSLPGWPLALLGIAGFFVCAVCDDLYSPGGSIWPLCFGLCSAIAAVGLMSLEKRESLKIPGFLLFLGDASYSVYLVHYTVLSLVAKVLYHIRFFSTTTLIVPFTLLVVISTASGLLVHVAIERPLLSRIPR